MKRLCAAAALLLLAGIMASPCAAEDEPLGLEAKKGAGKATIATPRKYLETIYRTLKDNWMFENFNEFKLAETS